MNNSGLFDKLKAKIQGFFSIENEDINEIKRAQKKKLAIVVVIGLCFAIFLGSLSEDDKPRSKTHQKVKSTSILVEADKDNIARNKWLKIANDQLESAAKRLKDQENALENMSKQMQELKALLDNRQHSDMVNAYSRPTKIEGADELLASFKNEAAEIRKLVNKKQLVEGFEEDTSEPEAPQQPRQNITGIHPSYPMPPNMTQPEAAHSETFIDEPLEDTLGFQEISQANTDDKLEQRKGANEDKKEELVQIPATTVLRGRLLSGVDAPTMAKGKSDPLPILIQLTDYTLNANKYYKDLRDCFVIAEAMGDLASERAYIRTNTMHCVNSSQDSIVFDLKGYASGEDGKNGLRGRIVTKAGALIGRTILASTISGIGQAFGNMNQVAVIGGMGQQNVSNSALENAVSGGGGSWLPRTQDVRAALGTGISEAASKLADFYLKMADEVSPVIEISAGRKIDIIVTETATVDLKQTRQFQTTLERSAGEEDEE